MITIGCLLGAGVVILVWPRLPRLRSPDDSWRSLVIVGGRLLAAAEKQPRRAAAAGIAGIAGLGLILGGPVAAVVGAAYAGLAMRAWWRRARSRRAAAERTAALDDLAALAADLRAGLPPPNRALSVGGPLSAGGDRIKQLGASVWRLAERTGAPAADLVERIEADARAADRATAKAAAQAAGAQATAILLAILPLGGIVLGLTIGADPGQVLLRTPVGAGCAISAVALQCAGLLWTERLVSGAVR